MKKIIVTGLILLAAAGNAFSQPHHFNEEKRERIHAMKIAYLTDHLRLTPEEAQSFWPVYNEYDQKRLDLEMSLSDQFGGKKPDIETLSDEQIEQFINERLKQEEQIVRLKKEYFEKIKKTLPVRKVFLLFEAEAGFKRMLLERLQDGPHKGPDPRGGR